MIETASTSHGRRPLRVLIEVVVIVGSILLAFAIDAAWDGRTERMRARQSLEVLANDLEATIRQLDDFLVFAADNAEASYAAFMAISEAPTVDSAEAISEFLNRSLLRRTLRLPRAALSDLVTSEIIGSVRSVSLRRSILTFREDLDRSEAIIERNSARYNDELLAKLLIDGGLLLPRHVRGSDLNPLAEEHRRRIAARLGADFRYPADPLWRVPPDASEWDRLRSALLAAGNAAETSGILASQLRSAAETLKDQIRVHLAGGDIP